MFCIILIVQQLIAVDKTSNKFVVDVKANCFASVVVDIILGLAFLWTIQIVFAVSVRKTFLRFLKFYVALSLLYF